MTDPVTNNRSLVQPTVGGDIGTWGGVLNNNLIAILDQVLGPPLALSMTSADVTLTTAQFQYTLFNLSGTLTGNHSLILPLNPNSGSVAVGGFFMVLNNTSGAFTVTVKTAALGSTGVTVPQSGAALLYSDGTNVNYALSGVAAPFIASNGNPNGSIAGFAGSSNTNPSVAYDYVNNIIYVCTTTGNAAGAVWSQPPVTVPRGVNAPINLGLAVTHTGGNLLQLAIKQADGSTDATTFSPVIVQFNTVSGGNLTGAQTQVNITGALSMTTNAVGASMGTSNNTPFRIWFALFNNAGTAVPAMRVCSTPNGASGIGAIGVASTTAISGAATSAGVWYTPNGTALTSCAYRLIGYCEYLPGNLLAAAGTYTSDPSNKVLYGPDVPLPGAVVQYSFSTFASGSNTTNTTFTATNTTASVSLTSAVNLVRARATGTLGFDGAGGQAYAQLGRNSNANMFGSQTATGNWIGGGVSGAGMSALEGLDMPATTASTAYTVYIKANGGSKAYWSTTSSNFTNVPTSLSLEEIMG